MEELKYPIGKFKNPGAFDESKLQTFKEDIKALPQQLKDAILNQDAALYEKRYRPDGWTVRQVIHHISDSHVNSYIRYRWTLTEDTPMIKAYDQSLWSELADAKSANVELSVTLLTALHAKWTNFLDLMTEEDYNKAFVHPETGSTINLFQLTGLYAWHGKHHLAHIELAKTNPY